MASQPVTGLLRALLVAHDPYVELPDADLLNRFHFQREQAAFTELVRRYGPMVFGVCKRVVGQSSDADDAFQAVFLVLSRKAGGIQRPELLGHWLYRVAYRIGLKARRVVVRRRKREISMANVPELSERPHETYPELAGILDDELARLAEWYRLPIVLYDLQGLSRAEAAIRLGIPEGTLSSRLANGRKKLAERLTTRGITLAILTSFLSEQVRARVPEELLAATIQTARDAAVGGTVTATISYLAYQGVFTMRMLFLIAATASLATVSLALTTAPAEEKKVPPIAKVEAKKDEPKANESTTHVEYGKPRMLSFHDLDGAPQKLLWGADAKNPLLFVEQAEPNKTGQVKYAIRVYLHDDHTPVTQFELPKGHRIVDVFPKIDAFVSARIESSGINSVRELRYFQSNTKLETTRQGFGKIERNGKLEGAQNTFEDRIMSWIDPKVPGFIRTVPLDEVAGEDFKLTIDGKGIWNSYRETNDTGETVRLGLRLLNPVTGEVLKKCESVQARTFSLQFDATGRNAVAVHKVPNKEYRVTCWNLEKCTIAWTATAPKEMHATSATVSKDGQFVAVAYDINESKIYESLESLQRGNDVGWPQLSRKRKEELEAKFLPTLEAKFLPTTVHLIDAATGKLIREIALKQHDLHLEIELSPDVELLLVKSNLNGSKLVKVYETRKGGKLVHVWKGDGLCSFRPFTSEDTKVVLAIAENNSQEDRYSGRLGFWRFDKHEVEDEK